MPRQDINALIFAFLQCPTDLATIDRIVDYGEDAFEIVDTYPGPFPDGMDARDAGDMFGLVLARISERYPAKLAQRLLLRKSWGRKWRYLYVAAHLEDPSFGPLIVDHLGDRSSHIKDAVIDILTKHENLWSKDAAMRLRKLLKGKAVNHMTTPKSRIEELLRAMEEGRS